MHVARSPAGRRASPLPVWSLLMAAGVIAAASGCGQVERGGRGFVRAVPGASVQVTAREYGFTPARVDLARAGELRFVVRNAGSLPHDLRLRDERGRELGGTPAFERGSRTVTFVLRPGRYTYYCSIGDHERLGMRGTLVVRTR